MFSRLFAYATSGITDVISKYAVRASVAIPFLLAVGYGLAGVTVMLIDAYGYRRAYFLLAGGFVTIGVLAAVAVWLKERGEEDDTSIEASTPSAQMVTTSALKTAKQMPAAIVDSSHDISASFRALAKLGARNWPLVLAGSVILLLLGAPARDHADGR